MFILIVLFTLILAGDSFGIFFVCKNVVRRELAAGIDSELFKGNLIVLVGVKLSELSNAFLCPVDSVRLIQHTVFVGVSRIEVVRAAFPPAAFHVLTKVDLLVSVSIFPHNLVHLVGNSIFSC